MADPPPERHLLRTELERMVRAVDPDWRLGTASLAGDGVTPVYHATVETSDGGRECVLKAARDDGTHAAVGDAGAEARLLAVVRDHTSVPVPAVLGAVDDHPGVRTPFFLMAAMEGSKVHGSDVGGLPDATLRAVARQSGRHLAELHGIEFQNVTTFGRGIHPGESPSLRGGRPSGDPAELALRDGHDDFRDLLREWWAGDFDGAPATHVPGGLREAVHAALRDRIADVPDSLAPTVARLDHGWHNLLLDGGRTGVLGVLDWGNLAAFPPAYDLALVEVRIAGGSWLALPEVPDRRPLVREALLAGYRQHRPVPPAFEAQRECYQLDVLWSWLAAIGSDPAGPGVPADRAEEAVEGFERLIEGLVE